MMLRRADGSLSDTRYTEFSEAARKYLRLEEELMHIRHQHKGAESDEEEKHLEKMDDAWWALTNDDIKQIETLPEIVSILVDTSERNGPKRKWVPIPFKGSVGKHTRD